MMPATAFNLLWYALPEVVVAFAGLAALTVDLAVTQRRSLSVRWISAGVVSCAGCVAAILLLLLRPESATLAEGMLVMTPLTQVVQAVLAAFTILVVLLSINAEFTTHIGEYLGIILFATAGMMVLVSTQNLLVIFASLELLSLSLYILTAFDKRSRQGSEAALKYFLFGGTAASFFLFGISLLYGLSGSIELSQVTAAVTSRPISPLLAVAIVMIVTGFGFKVAAAPFHLWTPDAYQGAPTPAAGLIVSSSKIAGFFVFAIVMALGLSAAGDALHGPIAEWVPLLAAIAVISLVLGNFAAIVQTSFRRLLAYSAIGHAGYMLLGIIANNGNGLRALVFYVVTYALATLGAFGVLVALEKEGIDSIRDFAGLSRRAPLLSFCLLVFLLSLAGIPPLAGFFGKFYIFSAAYFARPEFLWLVCLAIAMSVVGLYYYLLVLKQVYVRDSAASSEPIAAPLLTRVVVAIMALLVIVLGCYPHLLLGWINAALPH